MTIDQGIPADIEGRPGGRLAGTTRISDTAAAKIAAEAARRVPGVYTLGAGTPRAIGAIREAVGADETRSGVRVEVGRRQVAVDVVLVAEFGRPLRETADRVRAAVHHDVEQLVGLQVIEVNVEVADVHVPAALVQRTEDAPHVDSHDDAAE